MIAIMGAMDQEIAEFLAHSDDVDEHNWGDFSFYQAKLSGRPVVISKSGVGKVVSAMVTQRIIDQYNPRAIIFTGIAGAIAADLEIGDIIISRDCIQHDLDLTPLGFERGQIAFTEHRIIKADTRLLEAALSYRAEHHQVRVGRVLTGDQFFVKSHLASHRYVIDELKGDVVEMEGASVATVAMFNQIPFVIIRTVSDRADQDAHFDFNAFLPIASRSSYGITRHILEHYQG